MKKLALLFLVLFLSCTSDPVAEDVQVQKCQSEMFIFATGSTSNIDGSQKDFFILVRKESNSPYFQTTYKYSTDGMNPQPRLGSKICIDGLKQLPY